MDNEYNRRMAVKPLYDYAQMIILTVGVNYLELEDRILETYLIKGRWGAVKHCLELVETPMKWDELINELDNKRSKVDHKDSEAPSKAALLDLRKRVLEFNDWMLRTGKQCHDKLKNLSFAQRFLLVSYQYVQQADWALHLYGEEPPFLAKGDILLGGEQGYEKVKSLKVALQSRITEVKSAKDLKKGDLDDLVELIRLIERLDAREGSLIQQEICPKCGGKIVESKKESEENLRDFESYSVTYRVGCEKCDYELDRETFEL